MDKDLFGICPFTTAQKLVSGKWTMLIMHHLQTKGVMRFNQLQKALPNMTHATLSKQLQVMQKHDLIVRKMYNQIPPKVEYTLSGLGQRFQPVLDALQKWGEEYISNFAGHVIDKEGMGDCDD